MNKITEALHTRVDDRGANPIVTPIYQASAFQADSAFFYSRKNNPNTEELELVIAILEEAKNCLVTTTGMSAISLVLSYLKPNDILVVNKDVYGCSYKIFQRITEQYGMRLIILDLSISEELQLIPPDTSMIIFETPTNPFLKTIDIEAVSRHLKQLNPKGLVVVDNTWATSLFQQPLKWGADISLHSATKYFSGHSDVMGGCIITNDAALDKFFREQRFYLGCVLEPFSSWLISRSLKTLDVRMKAHQESTLELKEFLQTLPQVVRVYYPNIDGRQLTGYGTLLFFELKDELVDKYSLFIKNLRFFDSGTGMACISSMVAQPYTGSHASMSDEEKCSMGLGKNLVRLSFGMEDIKDLKDDLKNALDSLQ